VFHLTYIGSELRRRAGRTVLTAVGLALGVGLVIGIIGVSQALDDAQNTVLAPLQSVGTDILVTRVAGATPTTPANGNGQTTPSTTAQGGQGQPGGGGFWRPVPATSRPCCPAASNSASPSPGPSPTSRA
jgi:hypothetical protein